MLLHRVGQLDEGLELGRRGAVVTEPVLREAGQLADARRVGKRVAHGSEDPDRLLVSVVRVRIGGFHEPVEEVLPAPTAEAQDLGLDVARRTSTTTLRAVRGVALPVMLAAPGHPRSVGGLSNGALAAAVPCATTRPPLRREGAADGREPLRKSGDDLLSQGGYPQVPSALAVFTAVFGMGTGVSPPPWPPEHLSSSCQRVDAVRRAPKSEHEQNKVNPKPSAD